MLKDELMAADCMHDTFVKVHENWKSLSFEHPSSLLYTIATNCVLNVIRNSKADREDDILDAIADAHCIIEDVSNRSFIAKILSQKDKNTGVMAVMHFCDGWSVAEVADHFGITIPAVRKRFQKLQEVARREFADEQI